MALLTTGLIKNTEVSGVKPTSTISIRMTNAAPVGATIRINGFYWTGTTKVEYVLDVLSLASGEVATRNYYAQFDAYEFRFITSTDAVEISACGQNAVGCLSAVHSMVPAAILPTSIERQEDASSIMIPSVLNQIYVLNSSNNSIAVIDAKTHTFVGNVIVGSGPFGIGTNLTTNRIYVANFGSHNVSVLDGNTNKALTTISVGSNPVGVGVNSTTNRIYVTNWGSNSISVIDGFTHVVIATIPVGASPEGVNVNPATNRIYITNHGSNDVSVLDGSSNTVIATVKTLP